MKVNAISALLCTLGPVGTAYADCNATRVQDLSSLFDNRTVCATGTGANPDRWQEWHQSGGTLTEYAKGPSDPVDPSHDVGTWTINNNNTGDATITHDYSPGPNYTWTLHDNGGGNYSVCTGPAGTEVATAFFAPSPGQQACAF